MGSSSILPAPGGRGSFLSPCSRSRHRLPGIPTLPKSRFHLPAPKVSIFSIRTSHLHSSQASSEAAWPFFLLLVDQNPAPAQRPTGLWMAKSPHKCGNLVCAEPGQMTVTAARPVFRLPGPGTTTQRGWRSNRAIASAFALVSGSQPPFPGVCRGQRSARPRGSPKAWGCGEARVLVSPGPSGLSRLPSARRP